MWEGEGVVKSARKLIGATNPLEAEPGTIRGDFAVQVGACRWRRMSMSGAASGRVVLQQPGGAALSLL